MNKAVKMLWCVFFMTLTFGIWTFAIIGVLIVVMAIIAYKRPQWLAKI